MEIAEYTLEGTFVQNLYQSSDFSTGRFIYAPPGESTLTFSHDGTSDITAYVEVENLRTLFKCEVFARDYTFRSFAPIKSPEIQFDYLTAEKPLSGRLKSMQRKAILSA